MSQYDTLCRNTPIARKRVADHRSVTGTALTLLSVTLQSIVYVFEGLHASICISPGYFRKLEHIVANKQSLSAKICT